MPSNELKFEAEADPRVTAWLAEAYAPPGGDQYWSALEGKIMDGVMTASHPVARHDRWRKLALIAAGLLLAAGASIYAHTHAAELRMAWDSLVNPGAVEQGKAGEPAGIDLDPSGVHVERPGESHRGATFKDVIKQP